MASGANAFGLALVQMHVVGGDPGRNLGHAEELIAEAAVSGADIALLPEAMDLGWTHPSCATQAASIPDGEPSRRLSSAARRHGIYVCAGLIEQAGSHVYNAAVLIDPSGELLLVHRKLNELEIAHPYYDQGDRLGVAHTPLGTIGMMICADGVAADGVLSRSLGYMGADIILSPSAWAVPPDYDVEKEPYGATWRDAYQPVARDFAMWMVGVSNVGPIDAGPWAGHACIGASLVVDADGHDVLQGPYGIDAEAVMVVDVTPAPRPARGGGWSPHWRAQSADQPTCDPGFTSSP